MGETSGNLENASRRARLEFFDRLIREGKANALHRDRTYAGRSNAGDGAVPYAARVRPGRAGRDFADDARRVAADPALAGDVARRRSEKFLRARGIPWREDASNADPRFARNRIRHQLLPRLEREWNPELRQGLDRLADLAGEEERWWAGHIARLLQRLLSRREALLDDGGIEISAASVARLPKAVSRRLVRRLIRKAGGGSAGFRACRARTIALARGPRGSGSLELPGLGVARSFDWLRFAPPVSGDPVPETIRLEARSWFRGRYGWDGGVVCLEVSPEASAEPGAPAKSGEVGCVRLKWKGQETSALLELRGWRDGDHYRPRGRKRDQKLKEMFQKGRIPSWKRRFWPIVTRGSKILWAREFGPAAAADPVSAEGARRACASGVAASVGRGFPRQGAKIGKRNTRGYESFAPHSTSVMIVASSMWEYA